jgi:hypothetical protein
MLSAALTRRPDVELSSRIVDASTNFLQKEREYRDKARKNEFLFLNALRAAGMFRYSKKYGYDQSSEISMVDVLRKYCREKGPEAFEALLCGLGYAHFPGRLAKLKRWGNFDFQKAVIGSLPLILLTLHENRVDIAILLDPVDLGLFAGYYAAEALKAGASQSKLDLLNSTVEAMRAKNSASNQMLALRNSLCFA